MAEISTCKYLLGTCYTCQKCLYCFKTPQKNLCKCKKSKQPARVNNPKRGQQIYQRVFTPNQPIPTANEFLFTANTKFSYNSNFNDSFSYTFYTACNSKFQRLGDKDKGKKPTRKTKMVVLDVENDTFSEDKDNSSAIKDNNVKGNNNIESDNSVKGNNNMEGDVGIEKNSEEYNSQEDNSEEEDSEKDSEEDNVDEVKVQIIIKNKDKKMPTAKTLTIQPANYKNVMEKINSIVQKVLGKKIKSTNYTTSYKAMNAHGPSNELEDELDFQEFLDEYKKVISVGKKMSMIIDMKNNITENKKSSKKHKKSSDESNSSSVEEEIELRSKKKKKSCAIREADLSKEEKKRSEVITALCEKYKCNIHTTSCYIQDHRHLQLNPARLQLWAQEIINKGTTYEIPPSFPTFDIVKSDVSVNKNNLTTQAQVSQAPSTTPAVTLIIFQLPPQFYQNSNVQGHQDQSTSALYTSYNNSNTPLSPNTKLPTIGEFLSSLDLKYNCNNVYANFEEAFLEEAITVNAIKDLSDEQLQKLEVVKIGWQKNIKQAAQRF
ncbi:hypothetical protein GLOIN_2v1473341 [Rhizophagus clarus]|uniref:SAM domain-containing protein n=1 Tax=Rhizophagus clarus TaxID=94130 RepID=A0A8H3LF51_9GLOM|nr:hypothetical protein GLOIN_2v1473341 [Rhizophagus clarus]